MKTTLIALLALGACLPLGCGKKEVKGWSTGSVTFRSDSLEQTWHIERYNATTGEMVKPSVDWETATARMRLEAERGAWTNGMWVFYDVILTTYEPPTNDIPTVKVRTNVFSDKRIAGSPERFRGRLAILIDSALLFPLAGGDDGRW